MVEELGVKRDERKGIFDSFGDDSSLLFFFLILVILFCSCDMFHGGEDTSLLFFFLLLVILFCGEGFCF